MLKRIYSSRVIRYFLFAVSQLIIGMTVVPFAHSEDSAMRILASCLVARGNRLYADFFEHHGPLLISAISWIFRFIHSCNPVIPRYGVYILFSIALWVVISATKSIKPALLLLFFYVLLSFTYGTTLVLSETWLMSTVILLVVLLFFHARLSKPVFWIVFGFVQLSLFSESPLYIPCAVLALLYFLTRKKYSAVSLITVSVLPSLLFFLTLVHLRGYWNNVILFNCTYVSRYTGSFPMIWISYVSQTVQNIFQIASSIQFWRYTYRFNALFECILITTWIILQIKVIKRFSFLIGLSLLLRPGNYHMLPFIFFALFEIILFLPKSKYIVWGFILLALISIRLAYTPSRYDFDALYENLTLYYGNVIREYTAPDDHILLFTGQKDDYILTNRMPGTYYYLFYPWVYDMPKANEQLLKDISNNKIKVILFDSSYLASDGANLPYFQKIVDFLDADPSYKALPLRDNGRMYISTTE